MQQTSSTKKRRLEALAQQQSATAGHPSGQQGRRQPARTTSGGAAAMATTAARQGTQASTAVHSQPAAASGYEHADGQGQFPYLPLGSDICRAHVATRLQVPAEAASRGNVEDVLEALMAPHMPLPVAQAMIAARTAPDKAVVLINPMGRVRLARPSASSKGQRQLLGAQLLPRAQRLQLAALPKANNDYAAMLSLHDLWCHYSKGVMATASPDKLEQLLCTLDWHGAVLRVVSSSNPIYTHRVGIVAKATLNTFVLVSEDGRSSVVPIKGSRFEGSVDCAGQLVQVVLSGDNLKGLKCGAENFATP